MLPASRGVLTQLQGDVLGALSAMGGIASSFGLAGGTALHEYYAGARLSDDLVLLTYSPELIAPFSNALKTRLPASISGLSIEVLRQFDFYQSMIATTPDRGSVRIDIGTADPPPMGALHVVDGVVVMDLADLVAGKAHAIADRREPRDAFDLWVIVTRLGYSMESVETLLFAKDGGIRDFPTVWIEGLRQLSVMPALLPRDLQAMLLVPATQAAIRAFLEDAAEGALSRARRRL